MEMIWAFIALAWAGFWKSVNDTLSHHYDVSVFKKWPKWFDPNVSWLNKYTWSDKKVIRWLLSNPLVFITDAWHFTNTMQIFCYLFAIITYTPFVHPVLDAFILLLTRAVVFHVFYHWVFVKPRN